jgi:hypothetical protein
MKPWLCRNIEASARALPRIGSITNYRLTYGDDVPWTPFDYPFSPFHGSLGCCPWLTTS